MICSMLKPIPDYIMYPPAVFSSLIVRFKWKTFRKRESKRMGKRIGNQIIRMPQPQAAYAYRVYGILALSLFNFLMLLKMCEQFSEVFFNIMLYRSTTHSIQFKIVYFQHNTL